MALSCIDSGLNDPIPPPWPEVVLPDTWPDRLNFHSPWGLWKLAMAFLHPSQNIQLPEDLPGRDQLPHYLLQEFHRLPNGNYSNRLAKGYIRGFEIAMLGRMQPIRTKIANRLKHFTSALDVGCGGGGLAAALQSAGMADVWGLDPSPYLLQVAAARYPQIHFMQGIAEELPFRDERFEAIGACFLFHELPEEIAEKALGEFSRVLKRGGLVAISEPSPSQIHERNWLKLVRAEGVSGLYFKLLARLVFEPYVHAWHQRDYAKWFARFGFELLEDETVFPARHFLARKM